MLKTPSSKTERPVFPEADVPMQLDGEGCVWFFPALRATYAFPVQDNGEADDTTAARRVLLNHVLTTIGATWGTEWLTILGRDVLDDLSSAVSEANRRGDDEEVRQVLAFTARLDEGLARVRGALEAADRDAVVETADIGGRSSAVTRAR